MEEVVDVNEAHYFDIPENLFHIRDPEYPPHTDIDDVLVRARGRLGENRYGITYNNCEHFVRFVMSSLIFHVIRRFDKNIPECPSLNMGWE